MPKKKKDEYIPLIPSKDDPFRPSGFAELLEAASRRGTQPRLLPGSPDQPVYPSSMTEDPGLPTPSIKGVAAAAARSGLGAIKTLASNFGGESLGQELYNQYGIEPEPSLVDRGLQALPQTNVSEDILGELALMLAPGAAAQLAGKAKKATPLVLPQRPGRPAPKIPQGSRGMRLPNPADPADAERQWLIRRAMERGEVDPLAQVQIDKLTRPEIPSTQDLLQPGLEQIRKNRELLKRQGVDTTDLDQMLQKRGIKTETDIRATQTVQPQPMEPPVSDLEKAEIAMKALGRSQKSLRDQMRPVEAAYMADKSQLSGLGMAEREIMRGAKRLPDDIKGLEMAEQVLAGSPDEKNRSLYEFLKGQTDLKQKLYGNPDERIDDVMYAKDILRRNINEAGREIFGANRYEEELTDLSNLYKTRVKQLAPEKFGPVGSDVPITGAELRKISPEFAALDDERLYKILEDAQVEINRRKRK